MAGRCRDCGEPINEATDYRVVKGYARIRRQAGGTNALRVPERTQEYVCRACVDRLARGVAPGQGTLV